MITYTVKAKGLDQVIAGLRAFERSLDDWEPFLRLKVEPDVYQMVGQRFDAEGPGWPALSASYKAARERRFPGRRILDRTGKLRAAATTKGAPGQVRRITPKSLTLGVNLPYGAAQHFGHDYGNGRVLPPRPYLQTGPEDKARWVEMLAVYTRARLLRALRGADLGGA